MAAVEFAINNKIYLVIKMSLFIVNYGRNLMIGVDIRKKRKVKKTTKFVESKNDLGRSRSSIKKA